MGPHPFSYEQLIAYALGELNAAETARTAAHLAVCRVCAATVANFELVRSTVRADDSVAPSYAALAHARAIFTFNKPAATSDWRRRWLGWLDKPITFPALPALTALLAGIVLFFAIVDMGLPTLANTLPGDTLYPVKTTLEDVQLALRTEQTDKVQVELDIAQTRVQELDALVAQGRYGQVPEAARDLEHHIAGVTATLSQAASGNPAAQTTTLAQRAQVDLSRYAETLSTLAAASPEGVESQLLHAAVVSDAAQAAVQKQIVDPRVPGPSNTPVTAPAINAAPPTATNVPLPVDTSTPPPANTAVPAPTLPGGPEPTHIPQPLPAHPSEPVAPVAPAVPTSTPLSPTGTSLPVPTNTPLPVPTNTPLPAPTNTPVPPPTSTPFVVPTSMPPAPLPTDTPLPVLLPQPIAPPGPANTPAPANPPLAPATSAPVPPPATSTPVPPPLPPTATPVPPPPTSTPVPPPPPTATPVPPPPPPTATSKPAPTQAPQATSTPAPVKTSAPTPTKRR